MFESNSKSNEGDGPWRALRVALHEVRSPIAVMAYAAELLLDPRLSIEPRLRKRHLESIQLASREAASSLSLLSRLIEVEQAVSCPRLEPVPLETFRDPGGPTEATPTASNDVLLADDRLARHMVASLWELASCFPTPRAHLVSADFMDGRVRIRMQGHPSFLRCLRHGPSTTPVSPGAADDAPAPFRIQVLSSLFRRALGAMHGSATTSVQQGCHGDVLLLEIPAHPPAQKGVGS